jgi:WhiB family transcriptional regulator, redox-sensing transcriptional regulator
MRRVTISSTNWRRAAACLTMDPDLFFPISDSGPSEPQVRRAKAVCSGCPVRLPCLQEALSAEEPYGVWGGLTGEERRPIIQRRRKKPGTFARSQTS